MDLHESLDATLRLLRDRLQGIEVVKDYGDLPAVECFSGQINQVFMTAGVDRSRGRRLWNSTRAHGQDLRFTI